MLPTPTTHTYKTVGDCHIKADVYRSSTGSTPTAGIVLIHGGCLMYGSRQMFKPRQIELFVQAGYTVVSIDYRLAPETKLPEIIEDLHDAFRWVHDSGPELFSLDSRKMVGRLPLE